MLPSVTLRGTKVCLEPMTLDHVAELSTAAAEDRSTYGLTRVPNGTGETTQYINQALAMYSRGTALPFVVRHLPSNNIIGTTRFIDAEFFHSAQRPVDQDYSDDVSPTVVEIGNTWYMASVQRTGVTFPLC